MKTMTRHLLAVVLTLVPVSALAGLTTPTPVAPLETSSTNTPVYQWNTVSLAETFDVYVLYNNTSTLYSVPVSACDAQGLCTLSPGVALPPGNAWWMVRANGAWTASNWTAYTYFFVPWPQGPVQIAPFGTVTTTQPTYQWYAHSNVTGYEFYLMDEKGDRIKLVSLPTSLCNNATPSVCSYTPNTPLNYENNWWYVRSVGGPLGASAFSEADFRPTEVRPAAPVQIAPSGIISTNAPTYSWQAVTGAVNYYLQVTDEVGALITSLRVRPNQCVNGTCSVTPTTTIRMSKNTWWWVRTESNSALGHWSNPIGFRYHPVAIAAPATISPLGTTETLSPSFSWTYRPTAASFDVYVVDQSGTKLPVTNYAASTVCAGLTSTSVCTITPSIVLTRSSAWWYVRSKDSNGYAGPWTSAQSFFVWPTPPPAPTGISPSGVIDSNSPTYSWNIATGAVSYELWASDEQGTQFNGPVSTTCSGSPSVCSAAPNAPLNSGNAWWWVRSVDSTGGKSSWAGPYPFRVP